LEQNWKTGRSNMKVVSLDAEDNFDENDMRNKQTMDSKSLAIGSPSGLIKLFSRKDLSRQKVFFLVL